MWVMPAYDAFCIGTAGFDTRVHNCYEIYAEINGSNRKTMTTQKTKDRATQTPLKSTHSIRSCLSV
jgi:hypothetical protein